MFNVPALLLDDALKLATPLTNGAINETLRHLQVAQLWQRDRASSAIIRVKF